MKQKHILKAGVNETSVEIWGSGKPRREFLYSEDMADACVFLLENRDFKDTFSEDSKEVVNTHINIGTGVDISIGELALLIQKIVGYEGQFTFNVDKPVLSRSLVSRSTKNWPALLERSRSSSSSGS